MTDKKMSTVQADVGMWQTMVSMRKKNPVATAAYVTAVINAVTLLVFSALSYAEIPLEWDWLSPGYYVLLYSIICGLGLITHVVGLIYFTVSEKTPVNVRGRTFYYISTLIFVLIFVVNMIVGWSFYSAWCPASPNPGIFACQSPVYCVETDPSDPCEQNSDPSEYRFYFRYQALHLLNALFLPLIVSVIVALGYYLVNPVIAYFIQSTKKFSTSGLAPSSGKLSYPSWYTNFYFYGGVLFYGALVVFSGLAFIETLYGLEYLDPWAMILSFTILGGLLWLVAGVSMIWFLVKQNRNMTPKGSQTQPMTQVSLGRVIVPTFLFYTLSFVLFLVGGWVYYAKHCYDEATGDYIDGCAHVDLNDPTPVNSERVLIDYFAFETLCALFGFAFPFAVGLLVHHIVLGSETEIKTNVNATVFPNEPSAMATKKYSNRWSKKGEESED